MPSNCTVLYTEVLLNSLCYKPCGDNDSKAHKIQHHHKLRPFQQTGHYNLQSGRISFRAVALSCICLNQVCCVCDATFSPLMHFAQERPVSTKPPRPRAHRHSLWSAAAKPSNQCVYSAIQTAALQHHQPRPQSGLPVRFDSFSTDQRTDCMGFQSNKH